jgi:hypothetical protein
LGVRVRVRVRVKVTVRVRVTRQEPTNLRGRIKRQWSFLKKCRYGILG